LTQVLDDGTNTYTYGLGRISQANVTTEYFLGDALGSVRQLSNNIGDITLAKNYEPYGSVSQSSGNAQTAYGYTGEYTDETGNVYLRARYYNPSDGRFLSRDTWNGDVNSPLSLNRWMYVEGNPVNYVDPSGQAPCIPSPNYRCPPHWPINPFSRFDRALDFIYNEMIRNSQGEEAKYMKNMLSEECFDFSQIYPPQLNAYLTFFNLTKTGGLWDHKWQLRQKLHIRVNNWADEYFPIRGNEEFEYYLDIWSNIHFGYVGLAIGFPKEDLENLPDLHNRVPAYLKPIVKSLFGSNGPGDLISVKIGLSLWETYGTALTKQQLHSAILNKTQDYLTALDINGNGILNKNEVNPKIGPLLPRGLMREGQLIGDWK
jgi:RHS repeat-associated protein